jgi:hypothetical protein
MKTNVGPIDPIVRIILGCAVLGAGYYFKSLWGLVGIIPFLTAMFRFCPGYALVGINSGQHGKP